MFWIGLILWFIVLFCHNYLAEYDVEFNKKIGKVIALIGKWGGGGVLIIMLAVTFNSYYEDSSDKNEFLLVCLMAFFIGVVQFYYFNIEQRIKKIEKKLGL